MFWMDLGPSVQLFYSPSPVKPWTWLISSLCHRLLIDPVSNLQLCSFSLSPVGWYPVSKMLSCSGVSHCSWLGSCHGVVLFMLFPNRYNLFSPCREEQPYNMKAPDETNCTDKSMQGDLSLITWFYLSWIYSGAIQCKFSSVLFQEKDLNLPH